MAQSISRSVDVLSSSLLESGLDCVGTEATDGLFFAAFVDVAFLVPFPRDDLLNGDDGFLTVASANFFRCSFDFGNFPLRAMVPTSSCELESGRLRIKTPTSFFVLLS